MATKIYLKVCDEDQAPLPMKAPWVVLRGSSQVIAEFQGEGDDVWSLELNPLIAGEVQLVLRIDDHPALPFSMLAQDGKESPFGFLGPTPRCASLTRQVITRGGEQSTTIVALQFNLARKHEEIIMVAGFDTGGNVNYIQFAQTLRDELYEGTTRFGGSEHPIPRVVHDYTVVTLFDFATGYQIRQIKGQKSWHELDAVLLGAKAPYTGGGKSTEAKQRRHAEDTISIIHVYDYIAALGVEAPGSLRQMNYFSHAWVEGPVLLNTDEHTDYDILTCRGVRDPGDKDPRCKDFSEENIRNFSGFCRAFATKGFVKVWGCFGHNLSDYVSAVAGLDDPEEMRPCPDKASYNSYEIAEKIRREAIPVSYLGNLITKAGIDGFGAAPSTSSNYDAVGFRQYMFVDRNKHGKHMRWFERMFDMKADEFGYVDFRKLQ